MLAAIELPTLRKSSVLLQRTARQTTNSQTRTERKLAKRLKDVAQRFLRVRHTAPNG